VHFLEIFEEEVDTRLEEFVDVEDLNHEWIQFKVLAEMIAKYSVLDAGRNRLDRIVYKDSQTASQNTLANSSQNGSSQNSQEEEENQQEVFPASLKKMHQQAMIMRGVASSKSGFCEYFQAEQSAASSEKSIGYDRIYQVAEMIFSESKVLKVCKGD
jgi:hypothetical protein